MAAYRLNQTKSPLSGCASAGP